MDEVLTLRVCGLVDAFLRRKHIFPDTCSDPWLTHRWPQGCEGGHPARAKGPKPMDILTNATCANT
eukprot:6577725-Alexandrium_andersonii.AAC.1